MPVCDFQIGISNFQMAARIVRIHFSGLQMHVQIIPMRINIFQMDTKIFQMGIHFIRMHPNPNLFSINLIQRMLKEIF